MSLIRTALAGSLALAVIVTIAVTAKKTDSMEEVTTLALTPASPAALMEPVSGEVVDKKVKKIKLNVDNSIFFLDEFNEESVKDALLSLIRLNDLRTEEPIYFVITSPGGSVLAGARLISAIEVSRRPVITVCDTVCASMGAMTHQYGKQRLMTDRSLLMFHNAAGGFQGEFQRIESLFKTINRYVSRMELNVVRRSGIDYQTYKSMIGQNLWIDSEDSKLKNLSDGFAFLDLTEIVKNQPNVANSIIERNTRVRELLKTRYSLEF